MDQEQCAHYWIAPTDNDGEPIFKANRQLSPEPTVHVTCSLCGARTWFTKSQYLAIPAGPEPGNEAQP